MVRGSEPRRGDVWLATFDPTAGSEIRKTRPCLIVSPDTMNLHLRTVTAMPMTSAGRPAPYRIQLRFGGVDGRLLGDQLRTLDKTRLRKRLGQADAATLAEALAVLREMFEE